MSKVPLQKPRRTFLKSSAAASAALLAPIPLRAQSIPAALQNVQIDEVASGLDEPWCVAFLPEFSGTNGYLVTLRDGALLHAQNDKLNHISGVPAVRATGQGGLFDVLIPQDFASTRRLYLSYAHPKGGTAVSEAIFPPNSSALGSVKTIFHSQPIRSNRHFGGRLAQTPDGAIFLTLGEFGDRPLSQDPKAHNGKMIRIQNGNAEIWSLGHRNPQGLAYDPHSDRLISHEHGAKGGDEVNIIRKGANYGWPIISYGRHYSGAKIGEGTAKSGMEQPAFYWDPSIAPSGLAVYSGKLFGALKGSLLVGSLKFHEIHILRPEGAGFSSAGILKTRETGRVRDVREAPDGTIWFLSVKNRALYRIRPKS